MAAQQPARHQMTTVSRLRYRYTVAALLLAALLASLVDSPGPTAALARAPLELRWSSTETDNTTSLAWGDIDADRDLDLVVGNYDEPIRLYRNNCNPPPTNNSCQPADTLLSSSAVYSSSGSRSTRSLALADLDNNGVVDHLAVGGDAMPVEVYQIQGGTLSAAPIWSSSEISDTYSLAWWDVDRDGDLDLAAAANCTDVPSCNSVRLYENINGTLTTTAVWSAGADDFTASIAWGDVDGDGDADLAVGNYGQPIRLYRNNCTPLTGRCQQSIATLLSSSAFYSSIAPRSTNSIAWADIDGNTQPDLVVGNEVDDPASDGGTIEVYRNTGSTLSSDPVWSLLEPGNTTSVAPADYDADGDQDVAAGLDGQPIRLYQNDSIGTNIILSLRWAAQQKNYTRSLAWADVDHNGRPDLAVGNGAPVVSGGGEGQANQLYRNTTLDPPPGLRVVQPGGAPIPNVQVYHRPAGQTDRFSLYTDESGLPARTDAKGNIVIDTPVAKDDQLVALRPVGEYTSADIPKEIPATSDAFPVVVKSTLTIATGGAIRDLNVVNLHGTHSWFRDLSFALRSPQGRQVEIMAPSCSNEHDFNLSLDDEALSGEWPCPPTDEGSYRPSNPLSAFDGQNSAGTWTLVVTDSANFDGGSLDGWGLKITTQNSASPYFTSDAITRYDSSAAPIATGVAAFVVGHPASTTIFTATLDHQLLLFDLNISLEWDARKDARFMAQLEYDIQRTSELLYDWTNGQAALGKVTIYQDRQQWESAHIRIYATNRLRPNADQGGIVPSAIADPDNETQLYTPGNVRIGTTWNRYGDSVGTLGEDWPRALAHELGHYMLFLDDNYIGLRDDGSLIGVENCSGAMSDPYRDDYSEFHATQAVSATEAWANGCAETLSERETGRSDWKTIQTFYPQVKTPDDTVPAISNPGPTNLPLPVTQVITASVQAGNLDDLLDVPVFDLVDADQARVLPGPRARAFLFKCEDDALIDGNCMNNQYSRLIDLGRPNLNQVDARGARVGDRLCVYEPGAIDPLTHRSATRLGCVRTSTDSRQLQLLFPQGWRPEVLITPVTSSTIDIAVFSSGVGTPAPATLNAALFPFDSAQVYTATLKLRPGGVYSNTIALPKAAEGAFVRVWADASREIVTEYSLGGNASLAPCKPFCPPPRVVRVEPSKSCRPFCKPKRAPAFSSDGQAALYGQERELNAQQFYSLQTATSLPVAAALPAWTVPVGRGYWLLASDDAILQQVSINISYLENETPAGTEGGIGVYFLPLGGSAWQPVTTTRQDSVRNDAAALVQGRGLYMLMTSLNLKRGWNMVAYPWQQTQAVTDGLQLIGGVDAQGHDLYTTIYGHVVTDTLNPWRVYDIDAPDWVNDLRELRYGQGYWINATTPTPDPAPARQQRASPAAGADLTLPPATYYGVAPAANLQVRALVNGHECGQRTTTAIHTLDQRDVPAFSIKVPAAGPGDAQGCGTAGAPFTIEFLNGTTVVKAIPLRWDNNRVHRVSQLYLPLAFRGGAVSGPDLVVSQVVVLPATPQAGKPTEVRITISNAGTTDISVPFWVDMYVDPRATPQVNQIWPQLSDSGASWRVYGLKVGETRVLSTLAPNDPLDPSANYSNFKTFVGAGAHRLFVLSDSFASGQANGAVVESNEGNNLLGPVGVTVTGGSAAAQPAALPHIDDRPSR